MRILRAVALATAVLPLALGGLSPATATGNAAGEPDYPLQTVQTATVYAGDQLAYVAIGMDDAVPNTTVTLTVFGCDDQPIKTGKKTGSGHFSTQVSLLVNGQLVPAPGQVHYRYTLAAPGYTAITFDKTVEQRHPKQADRGCTASEGGGTPKVKGSARPARLHYTTWPPPYGTDLEVTFTMRAIPKGAVVRLVIYGCRDAAHPEAARTLRKSGSYKVELEVENAQRKFNRSIFVKTVISKKGHKPKTTSIVATPPARWSCGR